MFKHLRKIIPLHKLVFVIHDFIIVTLALIYTVSKIPSWSKIHHYSTIGYLGFMISYIFIFQIFNLYRYQIVLSYLKHLTTFVKALAAHLTLAIYVVFFLSSRIHRPLVVEIYLIILLSSIILRYSSLETMAAFS